MHAARAASYAQCPGNTVRANDHRDYFVSFAEAFIPASRDAEEKYHEQCLLQNKSNFDSATIQLFSSTFRFPDIGIVSLSPTCQCGTWSRVQVEIESASLTGSVHAEMSRFASFVEVDATIAS